jgi:hypothetical protein
MQPERVATGMTTPDPDAPLDPDAPDLDLDIPVPASPSETNPDATDPTGDADAPGGAEPPD